VIPFSHLYFSLPSCRLVCFSSKALRGFIIVRVLATRSTNPGSLIDYRNIISAKNKNREFSSCAFFSAFQISSS
jgi:hypothetical protein